MDDSFAGNLSYARHFFCVLMVSSDTPNAHRNVNR